MQRWGCGVQGEGQRGPKSHGHGQGWRGKGGAEADGHEVNSHFTPWQQQFHGSRHLWTVAERGDQK